MTTVGKGRKEEVKEVLKKYLRVDIYIKTIRAIGGGLVVECFTMENKVEIQA